MVCRFGVPELSVRYYNKFCVRVNCLEYIHFREVDFCVSKTTKLRLYFLKLCRKVA